MQMEWTLTTKARLIFQNLEMELKFPHLSMRTNQRELSHGHQQKL